MHETMVAHPNGSSRHLTPNEESGDRSGVRQVVVAVALALLIALIGYHHGGYELPATGEVAIGAAWLILIGALLGLVPTVKPSGWRAACLALLLALLVWTVTSLLWSSAAERTVATSVHLAALTTVFALAVLTVTRRDREAIVAGVAAGIALLALMAVGHRFDPTLFSVQVSELSNSNYQARSYWPIGYWNALAFLCAIALPLLVRFAAESRRASSRALAAAAVPTVVLCIVFTLSRGGMVVSAVALLLALLLGPLSLRVLLAYIVVAIGTAVLVISTLAKSQLMDGLTAGGRGAEQADQTLLLLVIVSALVAVGCALLGQLDGIIKSEPRAPRPLLRLGIVSAALLLLIVVGLATGGGDTLNRKFDQFRSTDSGLAPGRGNTVDRLSATSSNGRWQLWQGAINAGNQQPLRGQGAGGFESWWTINGSAIKVRNAHSLYAEVYAELGWVGLLMIFGLLVAMALGCARALKGAGRDLGLVAAGTASVFAFALSAAADWTWQETVLPLSALLILAALLAPDQRKSPELSLAWRGGALAFSVVILALVIPPTASKQAVLASSSEALAGNLPAALKQAKAATSLQGYSATAWRQQALVLDLGGQPAAARLAAVKAIDNDPNSWQNWFVLAGIDARAGQTKRSLSDFRHARSLNPNSQLFKPTN